MTYTITVPLGLFDLHAHVDHLGHVSLERADIDRADSSACTCGAPYAGEADQALPGALASAAWALLGTWMLEPSSAGSATGRTMVPAPQWREWFGHRLEPVAAT